MSHRSKSSHLTPEAEIHFQTLDLSLRSLELRALKKTLKLA